MEITKEKEERTQLKLSKENLIRLRAEIVDHTLSYYKTEALKRAIKEELKMIKKIEKKLGV